MPMDMDTDEENSVNLEANDAVPANAVGVDCTMRDAFRAYVGNSIRGMNVGIVLHR